MTNGTIRKVALYLRDIPRSLAQLQSSKKPTVGVEIGYEVAPVGIRVVKEHVSYVGIAVK